MSNTKAILLVGVGGQGTILASKILSEGLVAAGYDVKMSEIHGMSQRGGNVSTQIRYGDKVYSPIVGKGEADVIVSFEVMEALRWVEFLKPGGGYIINDNEIPSVPILMGAAKYPEGILADLSAKARTRIIDANAIAEKLGNKQTQNIVLLGAAIRALSEAGDTALAGIDWDGIIAKNVKEKFVDVNKKALQEGMAAN
ncbi:MAG: indolepyruvate oxidoreductase subunit beta [Clostridiales Family XIII bacterium]|jgi:indolepyruvate ferredoxin oxidoreductase beta subunit|nr:indolepyruvate oxidoreductase subunit beta [Clostridiales Family XIII bacterium]